MFNSTVLDIAIGLVVTYLALSLVISAANELWAGRLRLRAIDLEEGLRQLLNGGRATDNAHLDLTTPFFNHPLISAYSKDAEKPCYVAAQTFSAVVLTLVRSNVQAGGHPLTKELSDMSFDDFRAAFNNLGDNFYPKRALLALLDQAACDLRAEVPPLKKLTTQIDAWYDLAMERVTGWYIRRTRGSLLIISLIFVIALNIDTVEICHQLGTTGALRESLVEAGKKFVQDGNGLDDKNLSQLDTKMRQISGLGIPLGWTSADHQCALLFWITKFFGLMATVLATTLGAPFWFDLLKNFTSIRASGSSPTTAPAPGPRTPPIPSPTLRIETVTPGTGIATASTTGSVTVGSTGTATVPGKPGSV